MKLGSLLNGVRVIKLHQAAYGKAPLTQDVEIGGLCYDSRRVRPGDCFVALRGTGLDGHRFIEEALRRGASAVVIDDNNAFSDSLALHHGVTKIVVADTRRALALLAGNFFGHPSGRLTVVGVTGTNGKTTTAYLIRSILEASGTKAGLIGTVEYLFGNTSTPASHTTPESLELQEILAQMVSAGCGAVAMEVSSHALHQSRVHGIDFSAAVFTNLTQDHLDYHGSMDEYFRAKRLLFAELGADAPAVINADDSWGQVLASERSGALITYGFRPGSTVMVLDSAVTLDGTIITVSVDGASVEVRSGLVGTFNVYNTVAAFSTCYGLGIPLEAIVSGIGQVSAVRGRFERIRSPKGWTAIVDYAHTPDALENCLRTIRALLPEKHPGRVITVFGAGGDRDRTKRPAMGAVAASLSDVIILTSDNPRSEDPLSIIKEIAAGIPPNVSYEMEPDRRRAIAQALERATPGDVILVAGKGHEDYQIIKGTRLHFSDREIIEHLL